MPSRREADCSCKEEEKCCPLSVVFDVPDMRDRFRKGRDTEKKDREKAPCGSVSLSFPKCFLEIHGASFLRKARG